MRTSQQNLMHVGVIRTAFYYCICMKALCRTSCDSPSNRATTIERCVCEMEAESKLQDGRAWRVEWSRGGWR